MKIHPPHTRKVHILLGIFILITIGLFAYAILQGKRAIDDPVRFGITYSASYAESLGLDVHKTYEELIDSLGIKAVRLPVYWSRLEPSNDQFVWDELDRLVKISEDHGVKLTIVVGSKVPRWPECYVPDWAESLGKDAQQIEALAMIQAVVERYRASSAIERWQVENEPFFPYGVCEQIREKDLLERIALVRQLDTHPIQLTVSGEMEPWRDAAERADILGISLYRKTWNNVVGYFVYPLTPEFYFFRASLLRPLPQKIIVSELQAEPWFSEPIDRQPLETWYQTFTVEDFQKNIQFAKDVHLSEAYLWGAEWWMYMKSKGDVRLWKEAEKIFKESWSHGVME